MGAEVKLDLPGAGLPPIELAVVRISFFGMQRVMTPQSAARRFECEAERILKVVDRFSLEQANKPVLIPRITGIEDSSRNWSMLMTLDHLAIVNSAIATIIEHLATGKIFPKAVSTADVKPLPEQSGATIDRFRETTQNYLTRIRRLESLKSHQTHAHPWFGPLDGRGWHCLAAIHQAIHRRQTERIAAKLGGR